MTEPIFKDHFSIQSSDYQKFRPVYPDKLYHHLARISPGNDCAWDCATGNGQAAVGLSRYFKQVIATDASSNQLAHAMKAPNIHYQLAAAERVQITDKSIDLITVAQALHWFDIDAFYAVAKCALKNEGIIAIWSYNLLSVSSDIDQIINHLYADILGQYWPAERHLIESAYRDIPFPFQRINCPEFTMHTQWNLHHLTGYLQTWSAVQNYIAAHKMNPVHTILPGLISAWGNTDNLKIITWPLHLQIGQHHN